MEARFSAARLKGGSTRPCLHLAEAASFIQPLLPQRILAVLALCRVLAGEPAGAPVSRSKRKSAPRSARRIRCSELGWSGRPPASPLRLFIK